MPLNCLCDKVTPDVTWRTNKYKSWRMRAAVEILLLRWTAPLFHPGFIMWIGEMTSQLGGCGGGLVHALNPIHPAAWPRGRVKHRHPPSPATFPYLLLRFSDATLLALRWFRPSPLVLASAARVCTALLPRRPDTVTIRSSRLDAGGWAGGRAGGRAWIQPSLELCVVLLVGRWSLFYQYSAGPLGVAVSYRARSRPRLRDAGHRTTSTTTTRLPPIPHHVHVHDQTPTTTAQSSEECSDIKAWASPQPPPRAKIESSPL